MAEKHSISGGQLFAFSAVDGPTDWRHGFVGRWSGNSLEFKLPTPGGALVFPGEPDGVYGDCFTAGATRGALADAYTLLVEGEFHATGLPDAYAMQSRGTKHVIAPREFFDPGWLDADFDAVFAARKKWLDALGVNDTVLRRALSQLKTQICSQEGAISCRWTTPDRWPHRNLWLWDSVFHALGLRHVDPDLAEDAIRAVFSAQDETGFVPHMTAPDGASALIQPPVIAYGIAKVLEKKDDANFLAELYPRNKAFLDWIALHRDRDGDGLFEYFADDRPRCRCGESGMDNSPRFDAFLSPGAVDLNAFYARECKIMAGFARRLGLENESSHWETRAGKSCALINERLWNENAGLYLDYDAAARRSSDVLSSAGFLPLVSGAPTLRMAKKMAALLRDPRKFGTALPVPSVARDSSAFSTDMWRGPVWINVNMMISEGLREYGLHDLSGEIGSKTRAAIEKYFHLYGSFYEFYDADDETPPPLLARKGYNDPVDVFHQPLRDYGWTAALYIDGRFSGGMQ